jgi:hypothetical protein
MTPATLVPFRAEISEFFPLRESLVIAVITCHL